MLKITILTADDSTSMGTNRRKLQLPNRLPSVVLWSGIGLGSFSLIGFALHRIYALLASFPMGTESVAGSGIPSSLFVAGFLASLVLCIAGVFMTSRPQAKDKLEQSQRPSARAA